GPRRQGVWASLVPHRGVKVKENPAGRGPHGAIRQSRKGNGLARKESPAGVGGANVIGSSKFRQYLPFVLQSHDFVDEYYSERNASIFCRRRSAGGALQSLLASTVTKSPIWSPNCISTRYLRLTSWRRQPFSVPICSQPSTKVPRPRKASGPDTGRPALRRLARVAWSRSLARLEM